VRLSAVACTFGYTFGCHVVAQNLLRSMLQQNIGKAAAIAAVSAHTDCNKYLLAKDIC
jgi:hypothetical protein